MCFNGMRNHNHERRVVDQSRRLLAALDECLGWEPPASTLNVKSIRSWKYSTKSVKCPQCSGWSGQLASCQMKCISDISLPIWPVCRIYVRTFSYIALHAFHYYQYYTYVHMYRCSYNSTVYTWYVDIYYDAYL